MTFSRIGVLVMVVGSVAGAAEAQTTCPTGLPPGTTCYSGIDANQAHYLIAVPDPYANQLILWNHGYSLSAPGPLSASDLGSPALLLTQGFAVAASSYRPNAVGLGGWAVADGAADTENLRRLFVSLVGRPDRTFVAGASEGGIITAAIIERFGTAGNGTPNYDGALPMCGPLAGGRRNWYGGFDLRVVYQHYCQNLPRPNEPQYPLYLGLAPGSTMSPSEVVFRVNECTGILLPPASRTPAQRANLANILGVTTLPESFLLTDMGFATFALQELVQVRTGGLSPVTNLGVVYTGSTDDAALNAGVFRSGADAEGAAAWLSAAYDPTGNVAMPTVTIHTIGDGLVLVENEHAYRATLEQAGTVANLFQTYTNASGHCTFSRSEFRAAFAGLQGWVATGQPPTQAQVVTDCEQFRLVYGDTCSFNTTFAPGPFDSRVRPRVHVLPRGDFNGDSKPDLVWRHGLSGQNAVWFMNGANLASGTFTNPASLPDTNWNIVGTNDFSGDGKPDLLWRHEISGENVVWFMNGVTQAGGTYTTPSALVDVSWKMVGTGDFNQDFQPDILWRHDVSGQNVVWFMNGTTLTSGTFTTPPALADVNWKMAGVGDFNRNGKPDILWHHQVSGQIVLWYMDGVVLAGGTFTSPPALDDVNWKIVAVGDYNADQKPDIVWRHQVSGQNVVWFMDNATLIGGVFTNPSALADTNWKVVGPR